MSLSMNYYPFLLFEGWNVLWSVKLDLEELGWATPQVRKPTSLIRRIIQPLFLTVFFPVTYKNLVLTYWLKTSDPSCLKANKREPGVEF